MKDLIKRIYGRILKKFKMEKLLLRFFNKDYSRFNPHIHAEKGPRIINIVPIVSKKLPININPIKNPKIGDPINKTSCQIPSFVLPPINVPRQGIKRKLIRQLLCSY